MKGYAEAMEQTAKDLEDIQGVYRPMARSALDSLQFLVSLLAIIFFFGRKD